MATPTTRARFETQIPEELQVDPGSAMIEELKARHPELPVPVFSTKALMHGRNAAGASAIREGFSWNPQMDLLWALGYPHVVLIADGLPEGESKQSMIDHWEGGGGGWISSSELANCLVIPRRGAHALLYELQNPGEDAFELDDIAFQAMSKPVELDALETAGLLRLLESQGDLPRASLVIEALVGPSAVLEVLCSIAEDSDFNERDSEFRGRAVSATKPLLRRVPAVEADAIRGRLLAIEDRPEGFESFLEIVTDPLAYARAQIAGGNAGYALNTLCWVDGHDALVSDAYDERKKIPDIPSSRLMFVGGPALIEREAANADKYDPTDVGAAYLCHYTSIRSPQLLAVELGYLAKKNEGPAMKAWLAQHRDALTPWLRELHLSEPNNGLVKQALSLVEPN